MSINLRIDSLMCACVFVGREMIGVGRVTDKNI